MSERKLQPWMRREQALIWTAVAAFAYGVEGYSLPRTFMSTMMAARLYGLKSDGTYIIE